MQSLDLKDEFFIHLSKLVAEATLPHFRTRMDVDNKRPADFDPVTEADRAAERAIRSAIEDRFPDDGILGEEYGLTRGDAERRWVIDPIDGTRAFISGLPVWGSLVGLVDGGRAIAGTMIQPFTGETYVGLPDGARLHHRGLVTAIATSDCAILAEAKAFTTSPHLYGDDIRAGFEQLGRSVRLMRYGCDCYAFAMLAAGHADLVIEPGLQSYDICGLVALIERAGGVVTTFDGARPEDGGNIVAAATPALHAAALSLLSQP